MPANKKYLSRSPWIKFGKLSAALLGSLLAAIAMHLALAVWFDSSLVAPTSVYSVFMVWTALMIIAYWLPKVWHAWALMGGIVLLCTLAIYLGG